MSRNVKVELDRAHLTARMKAGKDHAGPILAQQIIDDSNLIFTPKAENPLRDSARVKQIEGDWCATWDTEYAAYQYYGCWPDGSHRINDENRTTPGTTTHWAEKAKDRYGKNWETVAQREFVKGAER